MADDVEIGLLGWMLGCGMVIASGFSLSFGTGGALGTLVIGIAVASLGLWKGLHDG